MIRREVAALGAVARFYGGGTPSKSQASFWNGDIPWVSPKDMWVDEITTAEDKITAEAIRKSATNLVPTNSILCVVRSGILARKFPVALTSREVAINQDIKAIVPGKKLDARYLFYFLRASEPSILASVTTGATVHRVGTDALKALKIPLPPIEEQRRIVAVLDEAFAAISTATANAEKNLANARELFQAELDASFAKLHPGWRQGNLADLIDITHGFAFKGNDFVSSDDGTKPIVLTPGNYTEDAELVFGSRNTKRLINGDTPPAFTFNPGDLTVVMTDLSSKMKILGRPAFIETANVLHNQRIGRVVFREKHVHPRLIYYSMQTSTSLSRIRNTATGTMVRHTAPKRILANTIFYPADRNEQKALVERLDVIRSEAKALQVIQNAKMHKLSALKQSLLERAFIGELRAVSTLVANDNWKSPAFTAQVIALAYRNHVALGTEATFGRVKAQKALQLCESVGGVDLGRNPVKDAAGPNDFQHMLAAEEWAKAKQFFEFVPRPSGNGYSFRKLAHFNAIVAEGAETLQPVKDRIDRAIGLVAPMNSEQAELLATVHAAWNNLLLDGVEATEAAIIHEARENWHIAKQKFGEGKFRQAIATIRAKGIEPDGSAKRVGGQEVLLF